MNQYDLSGRTAVVTGGGSGIGYATAERFLRSGARVEIWGRDVGKLENASKALSLLGDVSWQSVDVAEWDQVEPAAKRAEARYGRVDILFNCAGHPLDVKPMLDLTPEVWRQTVAINLHGTFYCCKALAPGMIARGYGRIINTASMAGKEGNPNQAAYSSAKAGVIGMTKAFAKEIATSGVLVNAVCPTVFDTPLVRDTIEKAPEAMKSFIAKIPMQRLGLVEEAAALVTWLASDDCGFNTGFTFDLSGGRATY